MKLVGVGLECLELSEELWSGLVLQPADLLQLPGQGLLLPSPSKGTWEVELLLWWMEVQRESTDTSF